jgi:hypothetical protein
MGTTGKCPIIFTLKISAGGEGQDEGEPFTKTDLRSKTAASESPKSAFPAGSFAALSTA